MCACDLYPCCYSLRWRAALSVFLCHLGGVDRKGRSRAIQTVTDWGRVPRSQRHKQCGQSHMTPRRGSHQLPLGWGASAPADRWHQIQAKQWGLRDLSQNVMIQSHFSFFAISTIFSKVGTLNSLCTLVLVTGTYTVDLGWAKTDVLSPWNMMFPATFFHLPATGCAFKVLPTPPDPMAHWWPMHVHKFVFEQPNSWLSV